MSTFIIIPLFIVNECKVKHNVFITKMSWLYSRCFEFVPIDISFTSSDFRNQAINLVIVNIHWTLRVDWI